ncbi:Crp/Fnr family transcriptional regulator [Bacillus sonorensis]|uniref:Crp/Fnr family transcriptional regulator n=1 Tax=Bacillus sonorensis TaxID=119858 RepID=UPI002DBA839C|nr:Crp/Fnr family transcriptional regulator [Bacillus sonorensis]MEC1353950.1 Crp/Fnr family transcriptional regulator [Bacillus sonorensis]MEC1428143.1 Crp/Fnr family transcriptional regulator [Bacillus sonorensis]
MKIIQDSQLLETILYKYRFENMFDRIENIPFRLQQYEPGEIILHEGSDMESLLFLVEGKLKVTSSVETGKSLLLRFSYPLSVIGDIELIRGVPVQSQIEAVGECLLVGLSFQYIRRHEIDNPKLLHTLLDHLSYKLQTCTTASRVNLLASVENRFASYLVSTLSNDNNFGAELKTANIEEISNLLGTTHRHLNRVIHSLSQRKIIERNKDSIRILNWTMLKGLSNGIRYE